MSDPDPLALDRRAGLPPEWLYLRDSLPRDRWGAPDLNPVARHWLAMHAGFRAQQTAMADMTGAWRARSLDAPTLHRSLIPQFLQHLDAHHRIESGHYFPAFQRIEPRIADGVALLDRDHDAIHAHIEALIQTGRAFHQAVATGADATDPAHRLAEVLDRAGPQLARHLDDEEDIVIPLIALRGDPLA